MARRRAAAKTQTHTLRLARAQADHIRNCLVDSRSFGHTVLAFFSTLKRTGFASGEGVNIVAMDALGLFELTRGATLMLDPNDDRAALYPEEISALLSGKPLVVFGLERILEPETVGVRGPTVPIDTPITALRPYYESDPEIAAAYIQEVLRGQDYRDASLLVAIAAPRASAERVNRTSMQRVQPIL